MMKTFLLTACVVLGAIGIAKIIHALLSARREKKGEDEHEQADV